MLGNHRVPSIRSGEAAAPRPWLLCVAGFAVVGAIACTPKADPVGNENCAECDAPGVSNFVCYLKIENQLADQEAIICSRPELEFRDIACDEKCIEYSMTHAKACLNHTHGGPFLCHDGASGDGADGNDGSAPEDSGADTTAGAIAWEPALHVTFETWSSTYVIDRVLVDELKYDASPLAQDGTRLEEGDLGFEFVNVTQGSLAWELGFRDGDIPSSIDDYDVRTFDGVLEALAAVYEQDELTVKFSRDGAILIQDFRIE